MSYELQIEDLNITLVSNSVKLSNYSNNLITINNTLANIQNNIDTLITKISELRLDKQIANLRQDICGLTPAPDTPDVPVFDLSRDLPNINVDPNASNNIIKLMHKSENTVFNYSELALTEDFSLKFENMNKVFRVKYSNEKVNNVIFYVYGFKDEVISVVESNAENISNYIANVYYSDVSVNESLDVVNLLVKEEENYKLLIIDGSTKRVLASVNINLLGDNPMTIPLNTTFTDPGATATNSLGQLIDVIVTSNVDPLKIGKYNVVYKATDALGNDVEQVRVVNVV
tara:strand:- start:1089 stop:1949 length:861 start_codon:yes stop_codon:yes gene_type:complete